MQLTFDQVEQAVLEHIDLIEISSSSLAQGKDRAAKFLIVQSLLSSYLKQVEEGKAKAQTLVSAEYATAIACADGKNITEKKQSAEADPKYTAVREKVEELDAEIRWLKTHIDIFQNAHVMFRQYTRE